MAVRSCAVCAKEFYAKPRLLALGHARHCSRACANIGVRKGKEVKCSTCDTVVYKSPRDLVRSRSKKYFCNKHCQTLWRNRTFVGERHGNFNHGRAAYRNILKRTGREEMCVLCKTIDTRILQAHHIDRDRKNNKPENLTWLCLNCHFLVHRYDVGRDRGLLKVRS
jgi:hypothetical protein